MKVLVETNCPELELLHRGKVRDMYGIPGHPDKLLIVATDRISAYDVVMAEPVAGKGRVLTNISLFWFDYLGDIVPNHLITANVDEYPEICHQYRDQLEGRSMLVLRTKVMPIECIVRGYISGSFWKAYKKAPVESTGCVGEIKTVCGFDFPSWLQESQQLPEPLFTPSTKAEQGLHDENISLDRMEEIVGKDLAAQMAAISLALYRKASDYARTRGIIIADTKFELGMVDGELILIDEVLTPDSSRFWPLDQYEPGHGQPSFDKQFLRDYLSSLDWDKQPPPPPLPDKIIKKTQAKYLEAESMLVDALPTKTWLQGGCYSGGCLG